MKYYLIAGEASGDLHASNLIRALKEKDPQAVFRFRGGDRMAAQAGVDPVRHYKDGAVMGFTDVIAKAGSLLSDLKNCKKDIVSFNPDAVILVDYPGFNLKIARFAHRKGYKVFYYIAPKTWASRSSRNRALKRNVDRLFIVFPFEVPYFRSAGIPFEYEGNPLIDAIDSAPVRSVSDKRYFAMLPGSRGAEIRRMMPTFMEVADRLHSETAYSDCEFLIPVSPARSREDYTGFIADRSYVRLVEGDNCYSVLKGAMAAVINSGTASLEAALLRTPQVVAWTTTPFTAFLARRVLRVMDHIKYISLGNLCIDKLSFKELVQEDFTTDAVTDELRSLVEDKSYRDAMLADYTAIRESLGDGGAGLRVASKMVDLLR